MAQSTSPGAVYCGRIVGLLCTPSGAPGVVYRVSSRSFPNRSAELLPDGAAIVPRDRKEAMENPYISYRCLRHSADLAVASNGSHTDAVFERIAAGTAPRDAIALVLLAFDFEHDQLNTPRIVAAVRTGEKTGVLGIVRDSGLQVETVPLLPGTVHFVATYELDRIGAADQEAAFSPEGAQEALRGLFEAQPFVRLSHPVCGASAVAAGARGFEVAVGDADG